MSNISVIQIFKQKGIKTEQTIKTNSDFLENFDVEYLVYDNTQESEILRFIKKNPYTIYVKEKFESITRSILTSASLAKGSRLIFLEENDTLSLENVEQIEKNRLNLLHDEVKKINGLGLKNPELNDIYLYFKKEKTFSEKIKLATRYLF